MRGVVRGGLSRRLWFGLLPLLLMGGCSPAIPLVPVTGSVTVKGEPAEGAIVLFYPENDPGGITSSGAAGKDGRFQVMSAVSQGIAPGRYQVTVTWPDPAVQPTPQQMMMGTAEDGPDLFKGRYASRQSSPLKVEITAGQKELAPFELEVPQ